MNLYCVRLTAINPKSNQRQTLIINQVPAENEGQARNAAILRLSQHNPSILGANSDLLFVSAKRTDDAFWSKEA